MALIRPSPKLSHQACVPLVHEVLPSCLYTSNIFQLCGREQVLSKYVCHENMEIIIGKYFKDASIFMTRFTESPSFIVLMLCKRYS